MDETIQAPDQFADPEQFSLERAKLARRRKIAEQLLAQPIEARPGQMVGGFYVAPNPGEYFNAAMQKVLAARDSNRLDEEEQALARKEAELSSKMLSTIPAEGPERLQAQVAAMRNPSIRESIKAQMMGDEAQAKRIELGEQKAADRAFREAEDAKYKRTLQEAIALKQAPSVVIHQGGAGKDPEDVALDRQLKQARINALANPRPIASERKASLAQDELVGKIDSALEALNAAPDSIGLKTLIPGIALNRYDPEGVMARSAVAELSAEKAHELYGAAFTAAERQRANQFLPAAGDNLETITAKLANMRKLAVAARARASGQQSGASGSWASPSPSAPQAAPSALPKVGEVRDGYRYKGGNPNDQNAWEAVK